MTVLIDTLNASEVLRKADFKKSEATALIKALSPSADGIATPAHLEAALNKLKSELIIWMVGLQIATVSLIVALLG